MSEVKRPRRVFISKHVYEMCGMGKFTERWQSWNNSDCPRYGIFEDATHFWKCHEQGADNIWERSLVSLESWFNNISNDPDIHCMILEYLIGWRNDIVVDINNRFLFEELLSGQDEIGWNSLKYG